MVVDLAQVSKMCWKARSTSTNVYCSIAGFCSNMNFRPSESLLSSAWFFSSRLLSSSSKNASSPDWTWPNTLSLLTRTLSGLFNDHCVDACVHNALMWNCLTGVAFCDFFDWWILRLTTTFATVQFLVHSTVHHLLCIHCIFCVRLQLFVVSAQSCLANARPCLNYEKKREKIN